jgi:hypothetical protein
MVFAITSDLSGVVDDRSVLKWQSASISYWHNNGRTLDQYVPLHNPVGCDSQSVYRSIADNIETCIANARIRD